MKPIKFIQDKIPTWSTLAKIKRFKVIQSMYIWLFIVPVFAKSLSKLKETANLTIFKHSFDIQLALPFSWKLFYLSALFFTVANLIFIWKCYQLVKDHNNFSDFQEQGKGATHLYDYTVEAGEEVDNELNTLANVENGMFPFDEHLGEGLFMKFGKEPARQDFFKNNFWTLRSLLDSNRFYYRAICFLLYILGFSLIGIVFVQNFATVLKMFF